MHIGLIGGIGPAATDFYYRGIIKLMRENGNSLELTIAHADTPTLLANMGNNDQTTQAKIFQKLTGQLESAGADFIAVTSIAGHFCIDEFKKVSPLRVLDLIEVVGMNVRSSGYGKIGILGTKTVMSSHFYGALDGVKLVLPDGDMLDEVHDAYVAMAGAGKVEAAQRQLFFEAGKQMCTEQDAEAVMLGGTDLFLAFQDRESGFPVIDCAQIHAEAIVRNATIAM
jgi:aspartate racemase